MSRLFVRASTHHIDYAGTAGVTAYPISIAAWIYATTLPAVGWVMQVGSSATQYVSIVTINGDVRAQVQQGLASFDVVLGALTTGKWYHLTAMFDTGSIIILVNGGGGGGVANPRTFPTQGAIRVGAALDNSNPWDGRIADVGIWDAYLTLNEVKSLAGGRSPAQVRPGNLKVYWPLYGNQSPEPDLVSGGGRNGTITGATAANHAIVGQYAPFVR